MSAPDQRYPDNQKPLSWFGNSNGKKRSHQPEAQAVDAMIERMKAAQNDDPFTEPFEWKGDKALSPPSADILPPQISHLDEIRIHLRQLTWAEMQEYCAGTSSDPKTVHEWSNK